MLASMGAHFIGSISEGFKLSMSDRSPITLADGHRTVDYQVRFPGGHYERLNAHVVLCVLQGVARSVWE